MEHVKSLEVCHRLVIAPKRREDLANLVSITYSKELQFNHNTTSDIRSCTAALKM